MTSSSLSVFERGTFPRWAKVRQELDATEVGDVAEAVAREFTRPEVTKAIGPGTRVCLTAGSRGIDRIDQVLKACGGRGASGWAASRSSSRRWAATAAPPPRASSTCSPTTASPRRRWAARSGPAWRPFSSAMVEDDVPVYFDRIAYEQADVVIPVGRVKPHTDFHGPIESGLMKMIAIGLGKQKGADTFHRAGFPAFTR